MKLVIEISLDNEATADDREVVRILGVVQDRILRNGFQARFINGLMDCNGNSVGTMRVEDD